MKIVFDAGHGTNTYPPSKGVRKPNGQIFEEHDFNSEVVKKAKDLAEKQGFEIVLSQQLFSKDTPLEERVRFINSIPDVALVVSFHANAATSGSSANGYGIFHYKGDKKMQEFCQEWTKQASKHLDIKPWGTGIWVCNPGTWSNFYIVRKTKAPCVLIEHFFYTNFAELEKCTTPEYIEKFAVVTVKALCDYFGVQFKEAAKTTKGTVQIEFHGNLVEMESIIKNNHHFVPLWKICELTGYNAIWRGSDKPIKMEDKNE